MTRQQLVPVNCPSMTTTQRDALTAVPGDVIYNTTLGYHQVCRVAPGPTTVWGTLLVNPMTTDGDIIQQSGGVPARLATSVGPGRALVSAGSGSPNLWGNPVSLSEYGSPINSGGFATYDRAAFIEGESTAPTSGTLNLVRIFLPYNHECQAIMFRSSLTAGATLTNQWFGLFDISGNTLALTADDTTAAWAANASKTLSFASNFFTTYEGWHYLGILIAATTRPTSACISGLGNAGIRAAEPRPARASSTGLTNPASCPATVTLGAANTVLRYAELI